MGFASNRHYIIAQTSAVASIVLPAGKVEVVGPCVAMYLVSCSF